MSLTREAFEARELRQGRPRSALYRTPAGEYEDAEVASAWRLWLALRCVLVKQIQRPRGIGPQHRK